MWFDSQQGQEIVFRASEPTLVPTPASHPSGREAALSSYVTKIKWLPKSTPMTCRLMRWRTSSAAHYRTSYSLNILRCIIYKHHRRKACVGNIEVTTTKIKCSINRSIITRIFCINMFNVASFSVIVRKYNNLPSVFSVSGKCIQLLQRELELAEVKFISTCRQV